MSSDDPCGASGDNNFSMLPGSRKLELSPPQLQEYSVPSYKDVLLGQSDCCLQDEGCLSLNAEISVAAHGPELGACKEGWQLVKANRPRPCAASQPSIENVRRQTYLRKMKGLCFNCLARDHKVASCRDPTRCWRCREFGHTSRDCLPSSSEQPSRSFSRLMGSISAPAPPHKIRDAIVDDSLLLLGHSTPSAAFERMDPMLLEVDLMNQSCNRVGGYSTSQLVDSPRHTKNQHPTEEIQTPAVFTSEVEQLTPVLLRSEAEKLVGQELIKALSDFKQLTVVPLSPKPQQVNSSINSASVEHLTVPPSTPNSQQVNSVERDSFMECSVDTQSLSHRRRMKIKSRKPVVKVVRDMLTKKWIFVKKVKQLSVVGENGELDEGKIEKYADYLKDLLPPNLLMALLRFKSRDFWDIVAALSPHLG